MSVLRSFVPCSSLVKRSSRKKWKMKAFGKQQDDTQEHRDWLTSKTMRGKTIPKNSRDWAIPVSTKTEAENAHHQSRFKERWKAVRTD